MAQNSNIQTYYQKLLELTNRYEELRSSATINYDEEACSAKISNTKTIQYESKRSFGEPGVKIKSSELPNVVSDYVAFTLCKLAESGTVDQKGIRYLDDFTNKIDQCKDLLSFCPTKSEQNSKERAECLDNYTKLYEKAMYIARSANWEVPVGCCKVILFDEDCSLN